MKPSSLVEECLDGGLVMWYTTDKKDHFACKMEQRGGSSEDWRLI